jgi:hypothetical protein
MLGLQETKFTRKYLPIKNRHYNELFTDLTEELIREMDEMPKQISEKIVDKVLKRGNCFIAQPL